VELDHIAGRVADEGLTAGADWRRVGRPVATRPQLSDDGIEIIDAHGEVLAEVGRSRSLEEMNLLVADVEPSTSKAKVGPIIPPDQAQSAFVERQGFIEVVHVDGNMVDSEGFHNDILADREVRVQRGWCYPPARACGRWCVRSFDLGTIGRRADVAQW
jgi:hypothetical protein